MAHYSVFQLFRCFSVNTSQNASFSRNEFWCYFSTPSTCFCLKLSDLLPTTTMLMHGSVQGKWVQKRRKAMDLIVWKKKKKRLEERVNRGNRERENLKKMSGFVRRERWNTRISQITMWHVFISWRKSSVLRQLRTEFKLLVTIGGKLIF